MKYILVIVIGTRMIPIVAKNNCFLAIGLKNNFFQLYRSLLLCLKTTVTTHGCTEMITINNDKQFYHIN